MGESNQIDLLVYVLMLAIFTYIQLHMYAKRLNDEKPNETQKMVNTMAHSLF